MYIRLRISDTLHKKPCRIGWGPGGTSENLPYAKFPESLHSPAPIGQELPERGCPYRRVLCALCPHTPEAAQGIGAGRSLLSARSAKVHSPALCLRIVGRHDSLPIALHLRAHLL
jgi:hypothetical protein